MPKSAFIRKRCVPALFLCSATAAFFACGAAGAKEAAPSVSLGLRQCIDSAIQNNIAIRLAKAGTEAGRARTLQAASALLPHLTGSISQSRVFRENLAALGFEGLGPIPSLLGPFNVFDARIQLVQSIIDPSALYRKQAAESEKLAAEVREKLAGEQVAGAAALAYVEAFRAQRAIEAAQAGERLAQNLLTLAEEKHAAGTATGLDVAMAKTRKSEEKLRVLNARVASAEAMLRLKHVAGIPLGAAVRLSEALALSATGFPPADKALEAAMRDRYELRIVRARVEADAYAVVSAGVKRMPAVRAQGEMALSGNNPDFKSRLVGSAGVQLTMPLFDGRNIAGQEREASSAESEDKALLDDVVIQIEEDVRLSLERLDAAVEQVQTAELTQALAQNELILAQGRFTAGVGDNVEVVNAQTALSRSKDGLITALATYCNSRINLALALGGMRNFRF